MCTYCSNFKSQIGIWDSWKSIASITRLLQKSAKIFRHARAQFYKYHKSIFQGSWHQIWSHFRLGSLNRSKEKLVCAEDNSLAQWIWQLLLRSRNSICLLIRRYSSLSSSLALYASIYSIVQFYSAKGDVRSWEEWLRYGLWFPPTDAATDSCFTWLQSLYQKSYTSPGNLNKVQSNAW